MEHNRLASAFLDSLDALFDLDVVSELHNLSQGESFILNYLSRHPESATPGSISGAMKTSTARTAAALRSLEAKGCILRSIDKNDRRRVLVELTAFGSKKVEELRKNLYDGAVYALNALGDDAEEFIRLIDKLTDPTPAKKGE